VLVEALHAVAPRAEFHTDEIVDKVSAQAGCHCIISTVSRSVADLNRYLNSKNRPAVEEYRRTIHDLLRDAGILEGNDGLRWPFLHLSLHGMRDRPYMDIELGTVFGDSCSDGILRWMLGFVNRWAKDLVNCRRRPIVVDNQELFGEPVIATHRTGDENSSYRGYGRHFNTVQIELAHWLRTGHRDELVLLFTQLANEFPSLSVEMLGHSL